MKRASYREAIRWIAENDSAADEGAADPNIVSELVSAVLVAEIFDVDSLRVGTDVVRARHQINRGEAPKYPGLSIQQTAHMRSKNR